MYTPSGVEVSLQVLSNNGLNTAMYCSCVAAFGLPTLCTRCKDEPLLQDTVPAVVVRTFQIRLHLRHFKQFCVTNQYKCVPGIPSPWVQSGHGVRLTSHLHLMPRLRMSGAIPAPSGVPRNFVRWRGGSTNSVEDRGPRENGDLGAVTPYQGFWRQL